MSRPISTESVFRAVAHPTRRRLLELLARGQTPATELAAKFHHTQPTLSRHLRILHGTGLVQCRRRGRQLLYRCVPGCVDELHRWAQRLQLTVGSNSRR